MTIKENGRFMFPAENRCGLVLGAIILMLLTSMASSAASSETYPRKVNLNGSWDFFYQPDMIIEKQGNPVIPKLPNAVDFESVMAVPGYWDDNLGPLREAKFWQTARFNPNYRPIEYPMGSIGGPNYGSNYLWGVGWYRKSF